MSDSKVTKTITLSVEAANKVGGGLASVQAEVKRKVDEIAKDASAKVIAPKVSAATSNAASGATQAAIQRLTTDGLRAQAALGDRAAAVELKKVAIADRYAREARTINAILKQDNVAEAERVALLERQATLVTRQAAETKKASSGGEGGLLKTLKEGVGEESAFAKSAKVLQGAGAVAGLTIAGDILLRVTDKAKELQLAFATGEKSAGDVADELARSLPVLGNIYSAGRNIREIIDGSAVAIAQANKEATLVDATGVVVKKTLEDVKVIVEALTGDTRVIRIAIDKEGLRDLPTFVKDAESKRIDLKTQIDVNRKQVDDSLVAIRQSVTETPIVATLKATINKPLPERTVDEFRGAYGEGERAEIVAVPNPAFEVAKAERDLATRLKGFVDKAITVGETGIRLLAAGRDAAGKELYRKQTGVSFDDGRRAIDLKQSDIERLQIIKAINDTTATVVKTIGDGFQQAVQTRIQTQAANAATLVAIKVSELRTTADLGDPNAAAEASRLEIRSKYVQQEQALRQILSQQNLDYRQKAAAEADLASLAKREADELRVAARRDTDNIRSIAIPKVRDGDSAAQLAIQERFTIQNRGIADTIADLRARAGIEKSANERGANVGSDADIKAIATQSKTLTDLTQKLLTAIENGFKGIKLPQTGSAK